MLRPHLIAILGAVAVAGAVSSPVLADVHTIRLNEFYILCDNGSTDVQYIELRDYTLDQFFRQCASLQIKRTVAGPDLVFLKPVFQGHADGEVFALGKTFLIATPAFQTLTGIVPDVLIPNGSLPTGGGVIRFAADSGCISGPNFGTIHQVAYGDQGTVPVPAANMSMNWNNSRLTWAQGNPTPLNFAGTGATTWTCAAVPTMPSTWGHLKARYN